MDRSEGIKSAEIRFNLTVDLTKKYRLLFGKKSKKSSFGKSEKIIMRKILRNVLNKSE